MRSFAKISFVLLIFWWLLIENATAEVSVFAQVDASKDIYVGESFGYHIIIDGDNKAGQADLAPLAQYSPQSAGNRDLSQTSISIINGKTTQNVAKRYVMSYSFVCNTLGPAQLPPVTVTLDGKTYKTNAVAINVLKPGTTELLDLEVALSEQQCYVGQPVMMTVKFYISADIGNFRFNIPAFTGDDFYIEEPDASGEPAKEYDLGNGTIVRAGQTRTVHNGRDSILLSFSKILIPKHAGDIALPPASVSADVAVGTARSQDSFFDGFFGSQKEYKRFLVSAQPLKLTVLPLPEEGKPAGFYGLVGQYTISASAAPTKINVGDPITLTLKIGGGKYLTPVQWPALEGIPELADNFKIPAERASPVIENGYKIFTQTIRAGSDKVARIPPIPLAYFDVTKGAYEIARTEPIPLDVLPTKILTNVDLEGLDFSPVNKEVEAIKKGLSANYEGPGTLINQTFSPLGASVMMPYLLIWAAPLGLLIVSSLAKSLTCTTPEKTAAKRRRTAAAKTIIQLKEMASSDSARGHERLALAMKQYIGSRFDKVAGSLTSNDCLEILLAKTNDRQIAEKYKDTVASCEAARYASAEGNLDVSAIKEAIELIKIIEKKSEK